MVHACIIASANMYEEPRPPRRGSHRPASTCYPPLSDWPDPRQDVPYQVYPRDELLARHRLSPSPSFSRPLGAMSESYAPYEGDPWTYGSLLPARRPTPPSNRREAPMGEAFSVPACGRSSRYSSRIPIPSDTAPDSFSRVKPLGSKVRASLELIRQLNGHVPDRRALEKSILESYARAAPQSAACQSSQKRCMYPGCTKISVSRGLCRGHGGGRRCHVPGCTKSAQSRSNFCWAHGGGQRCDVDQCMRSRKSKHFCVAHMHLEGTTTNTTDGASPASAESAKSESTRAMSGAGPSRKASGTRAATPPPVRALPSLGQALSSASRSAPNLPARGTKQFVSV